MLLRRTYDGFHLQRIARSFTYLYLMCFAPLRPRVAVL